MTGESAVTSSAENARRIPLILLQVWGLVLRPGFAEFVPTRFGHDLDGVG